MHSVRLPYIFAVVFCTVVLIAASGQAMDIVRIVKPPSTLDQRLVYVNSVLNTAMERTISSHGPYRIDEVIVDMSRDRSLVQLIHGEDINVHMVPTKPGWEAQSLAVKIPLMRGLLGYRLLLVRQNTAMQYADIDNLDTLKKLRVGLGSQWSTTESMKRLGFNIVTGTNYNGLFGMLVQNRFDYFPRGVNEVFPELDLRKDRYPDLTIAPNIALYLPLPYYAFVSPRYPELAARIEAGLNAMIADGSFNALFHTHFGAVLERADLGNRRIFRIDNPVLSPIDVEERPDLWYSP